MYAANTLYKSFIFPVLEYCDCAWEYCNKGDVDKLERLQRRAARIVVTNCDSSENALYTVY